MKVGKFQVLDQQPHSKSVTIEAGTGEVIDVWLDEHGNVHLDFFLHGGEEYSMEIEGHNPE